MLFRKDFYKTDELNEQKTYISELPQPTIKENTYLAERFQAFYYRANR